MKFSKSLLAGAMCAVLAAGGAIAAGLFPGFPIAGGPSYCSSYSNNTFCTNTVPAGPALTGTELVPADTLLPGGLQPQTVSVPTAALGANVLAQSTPLTGFAITVPNGTTIEQLTPAGTLATGAITFPSAPYNGQALTIYSSATVTAFTTTAPSGQTITGGYSAASFAAGTSATWVYQLSNTTWYRVK